MKKGFTLIELLAVIVILAIIALIATPIILGIINDAREESNERSIELYASAVRNAIAAYQLTGTTEPKTFEDLDIEYDGNVVCTTQNLYSDGSFYIANCTVNGSEKKYSYGTKQELPSTQVYKPQYYSWSSVTIGGDLPSDAKSNASEIDTKGYPFYLGLDVDTNNKVIEAYSCFTRNNTEYCLTPKNIEISIEVIKDAFSDVVDTACTFNNRYTDCHADGLYVSAESYGYVYATNGNTICHVYDGGDIECIES